ncbi:MAG: DNA double-strand break repair nuclease NurA [Anaerolineae bacterium]|nr:DNA double-strand break repair nuclease NurA [Anaerolineae bacterium]
MFDPARAVQALEAKRELLLRSERSRAHDALDAQRAFASLGQLTAVEVETRLRDNRWPGARLTAEHGTVTSQAIPFGRSFASHRDAREWALSALSGQLTIAVDGSQVSLSDDLDLPLAAAQVGWYVNPHLGSEPHQKDVYLELLVGEELRPARQESVRLDLLRFQLEVRRCLELMRAFADREPRPVCFLDDPLVLPFAGEHGTGRREAYIASISTLLEESERLRVPLIGYTADPSARDLGHLLHAVGALPRAPRVADAQFVGPVLRSWGDRSCVYVCARPGAYLDQYARSDGTSLADQIAFCYLRATRDGRPSRLEFPRWLVQHAAELSRVLDVVRAECIIGLGYPYAIEAAHDTAVLTGGDRARLARLFAQYCWDAGLRAGPTAKAISKRRRRGG